MTDTPEYSICLLTYNRQTALGDRWTELARLYGKRPDVEMCVLDNGSRDGTGQTIGAWRILTMPICGPDGGWRLLCDRLDENRGFALGFNVLVSFATGKIVVLLSDDVQVRGDFVGAIGGKLREVGEKAVVGQVLVNHEAGWNQFGPSRPIPYLYGHILGMHRATWHAIGGFDPDFSPAGYEDVDFSYRAVRGGYELVEMRDLPVFHNSLAAERYEHTVRMKALFAKKWNLPNIPARP